MFKKWAEEEGAGKGTRARSEEVDEDKAVSQRTGKEKIWTQTDHWSWSVGGHWQLYGRHFRAVA